MTSVLDAIGNTPLVELGRLAEGLGARVFAKCEHQNPGGSVKDRIAVAMIDDAEARGLVAPGGTLVEATAGNTGVGLALVAAVRGYRLVCVMPEKMSEDKREALRLLGAQVIVTRNAPLDDDDNFQNVARRLARENGWLLTDQFANEANVRAHRDGTGPEITRQLAALGLEVGVFVAGAGTGGTITGVGRYLKAQAAARGRTVRVVLADPVGSALAGLVNHGQPGLDGAYQIEGIGQSRAPAILDLSVIDAAESIADEESFAVTARLWREAGLLVGGSSGTAVAAALRIARRGGVDGVIVTVLPDSWDRYVSKPWMKAL